MERTPTPRMGVMLNFLVLVRSLTLQPNEVLGMDPGVLKLWCVSLNEESVGCVDVLGQCVHPSGPVSVIEPLLLT